MNPTDSAKAPVDAASPEGDARVEKALVADAGSRTEETEPLRSRLLIRTGGAGLPAHFHPLLYQLILVQGDNEDRHDLGFSGSRLLERLLQTPGEVVSREDLMSYAWADRVVGQGSLNQQIYTLRQVLGDEKSRDIIQTLPRRGYMFNPNYLVCEPEPEPEPGDDANFELPPPVLPQRRNLVLALPVVVALLAALLLGYHYRNSLPLSISTQQHSVGNLNITYINHNQEMLERLVSKTDGLSRRLAALSDKPGNLIIGMNAGYYELLCMQAEDGVRSLMFHKSQLGSIADAQLEACLP